MFRSKSNILVSIGFALLILVLGAGCGPKTPTLTLTPAPTTPAPTAPVPTTLVPTTPAPTTPAPTSLPSTIPAPITTAQVITSLWRCGTVADISLVNDRAGWAVVNCTASSPPRQFNKGVIYRVVDGDWQRADSAPVLGPPYSCYKAVSAVGPEEMWAVGLTGGVYTCNWGNWLLHYLDGDWEIVELDESLFTWHWTGLRDIDMVDAGNGWAVGYGLIFRYERGDWSVELDLPPKSDDYHPGSEYAFETISMASVNEGWAGGHDGLLFHYEDGAWTRWEDKSFESVQIMDIHTLSPDEAWAVGFRQIDTYPFFIPLAWRYTDDRWHEVTLPVEEGQLQSIRMISPDEGWVVGELPYPNGPVVLHHTSGEWESFALLRSFSGLESVGAVSLDYVWVGGWGFYQYLPPDNWQQIELSPAGVWPYD